MRAVLQAAFALWYTDPQLIAMREFIFQQTHLKPKALIILLITLFGAFFLLKPGPAAVANNYTYVTIHYDGTSQTMATEAKTVGELLDRAKVPMSEKDVVHPSKNTALISNDYNVNIYRARPVTVVDAGNRYPVMTAAQSSREIAEDAGIKVYPEDTFATSRIDDFLQDGNVGLKVAIDRAAPLTFALYGTVMPARTQATTVGEFLKEKNVTLQQNDELAPAVATPVTPGMTIELKRNGTQLVTAEEDVNFDVEMIRDADQKVGYRQLKEPGQKGRRLATYEVKLENNQVVARKELNSVVIREPKKQIEVVGTKPDFSGDFGAALARLRSCEGSYTSKNERAAKEENWYYGAYQFNRSTWRGSAPSGFENVRPDMAPPEVQDQAAANLYKRRGWQPWPTCARGLPDIYR